MCGGRWLDIGAYHYGHTAAECLVEHAQARCVVDANAHLLTVLHVAGATTTRSALVDLLRSQALRGPEGRSSRSYALKPFEHSGLLAPRMVDVRLSQSTIARKRGPQLRSA